MIIEGHKLLLYEVKARLKGYFDQSAHCWSMFTAIHAMVILPLNGFNIFCYFRRPKTSFVGKNG